MIFANDCPNVIALDYSPGSMRHATFLQFLLRLLNIKNDYFAENSHTKMD
jgi:hypothetical protein